MSKLGRYLAAIVVGAALLAASLALLAPQVDAVLRSGEVAEAELINLDPLAQRSVVLAADGSVLTYLLVEENRVSVSLDDVSDIFLDTLLAIEDDRFYDHEGVNLRATARALLTNVSAGDVEQGGSTITQQLVKNALVGSEQSLERKVREAVLARRLEGQMSKPEILERYVNTVYLGNSTYGVQAAAELYFGVSAAELDQAQSALLVGMIQNPVGLDPFLQPELAKERRDEVIRRLFTVGLVDEPISTYVQATPIPESPAALFSSRPKDYFVEEVKEQLLGDERLGATQTERYNTLYRGGLTIRTTLEPRLQLLADKAVLDVLPDTDGRFTAAIVSVDPRSGAVRAMVGGPGFGQAQYNIASGRGGSGRQSGSSFKPFVLATHLAEGGSVEDTISGRGPCEFENPGGIPDPYEAENFDEETGQTDDLRAQTVRSSNCAYLRLGLVAGLDDVVETATRLGITTPLAPNLSLPLGTSVVHPIDMASAYGSFANDGIHFAPYYVEEVTDRDGNVLLAGATAGERVLEEAVARTVTDVLADNVTGGTGTRARFPDGRAAAGKTGTTSDYADAWFVGFTPELSTAVWMGSPVGNVDKMTDVAGIRVTGGSFPARMWQAFMGPALEPFEATAFLAPPEGDRGELLRAPGDEEVPARRAAPRRAPARTRTTQAPSGSTATTEPSSDTTAPPDAATTTAPPTTAPPATAPPTTAAPPAEPGGGGVGGGGGDAEG